MTDAKVPRHRSRVVASQLIHFALRILRKFFRNRGLLLASAVGYNVLLSAVPMLALLVVLLTQLVDRQQLFEVITVQAQHLAPAHAVLMLDAVRAFMASRDVIGIVGIPVMLFFSSLAFRMLEDSIAIIFHAPDNPRRSPWVSVVLPYAFILFLGAGLLVMTVLFAIASAFSDSPGVLLSLLSFLGVFVVFSAFYKVLPTAKISIKRAVAGGLVAAILWEVTRVVMLYYILHFSFVNVIYGSLATIIILLLSLEVGAVILLLGAQVIAELERSARANVAWHVDPRV